MANDKESPVRYRETEVSEPSGFGRIVTKRSRVVETTGPIPEGCEATTDPVSDWVKESK